LQIPTTCSVYMYSLPSATGVRSGPRYLPARQVRLNEESKVARWVTAAKAERFDDAKASVPCDGNPRSYPDHSDVPNLVVVTGTLVAEC
jgi:hypothetical protein